MFESAIGAVDVTGMNPFSAVAGGGSNANDVHYQVDSTTLTYFDALYADETALGVCLLGLFGRRADGQPDGVVARP